MQPQEIHLLLIVLRLLLVLNTPAGYQAELHGTSVEGSSQSRHIWKGKISILFLPITCNPFPPHNPSEAMVSHCV